MKLVACLAVVGLTYMSSAQVGTDQNTLNPNPLTNTIIPGGGYPENTTGRDKTLVNDTPENVVMRFNEDYPGNTNVTWKQEGRNYRVTYTDRQTYLNRMVIYDQEGNVVSTETQLDDINSPSGVNEYCSKYYPNEKFKLWQLEGSSGKRSYYILHDGEIIYFDQEGNYIPTNKKSNTRPTNPKSYNTKSPGDTDKKEGDKTKETKKKEHEKPGDTKNKANRKSETRNPQ
jgi:hypothetical protein